MGEVNQIKPKKTSMEIKPDKLERLKKVRRVLAAVEDRDLTDTGLLDEILDEGLTRRERGLEKIQTNNEAYKINTREGSHR